MLRSSAPPTPAGSAATIYEVVHVKDDKDKRTVELTLRPTTGSNVKVMPMKADLRHLLRSRHQLISLNGSTPSEVTRDNLLLAPAVFEEAYKNPDEYEAQARAAFYELPAHRIDLEQLVRNQGILGSNRKWDSVETFVSNATFKSHHEADRIRGWSSITAAEADIVLTNFNSALNGAILAKCIRQRMSQTARAKAWQLCRETPTPIDTDAALDRVCASVHTVVGEVTIPQNQLTMKLAQLERDLRVLEGCTATELCRSVDRAPLDAWFCPTTTLCLLWFNGDADATRAVNAVSQTLERLRRQPIKMLITKARVVAIYVPLVTITALATQESVDARFSEMQSNMDARFAEMQSNMDAMKADINTMKADINTMKADMNTMKTDMNTKLDNLQKLVELLVKEKTGSDNTEAS